MHHPIEGTGAGRARCIDTYILEMRMDDGSYRRTDELSGGQRVSVLLSLLPYAEYDRPLVIDQPEHELDHRFLFDTVQSALKKLCGGRQVIVATHQCIDRCKRSRRRGDSIRRDGPSRMVACVGAIEEPAVRETIVFVVDGGEKAFHLRRRKYGF